MAENNSSTPLKTAEGNDLAIDIAEHTAEADAICRKLYNQYGHEQTAKNAREWIQIAKQLLDDAPQAVAAQAPAGNWINADDVDRLVRELDVALHGENDAAPQAGLCDVVGLVKEAARKLGRPVLAAPAAVAAPTSHFDDPCVQSVYNILCSGEVPPNGEHWEGFVARRIVDALATPSLPTTGQVLAITTAYEQGVGKGHDAHQRGAEIANPYCTSNYQCFEAWRLGYEEGKRQAARKAEVPNKTVAGDYPHEQMDALALAHYKVVPSDQSMFWRHAVVAGDGQRHLYNGSEVDCQNMARKFAGAFLDGAFAFHATQQTQAEVQAKPVAWVHPDYFTAFSKQGFQIVAGKIAPELVPLFAAPQAQPADALDAETPYQRGYRHGYNQRDAEVQGALL